MKFSIYRFDPENDKSPAMQAYEQYTGGPPQTDFNVAFGGVYLVSVSQNSTLTLGKGRQHREYIFHPRTVADDSGFFTLFG